MLISERARQGFSLIAIAAIAGGLTACSVQPVIEYAAPTMAPESQSIAEACKLSSETVDRLIKEAELRIQQGIEQAGADIANGKMPSLDFLAFSVDEALETIEKQVAQPDVLATLGDVRSDLQGFEQIERPQSLLDAPGYLASLGTQLGKLAAHGKDLRRLCDIDE